MSRTLHNIEIVRHGRSVRSVCACAPSEALQRAEPTAAAAPPSPSPRPPRLDEPNNLAAYAKDTRTHTQALTHMLAQTKPRAHACSSVLERARTHAKDYTPHEFAYRHSIIKLARSAADTLTKRSFARVYFGGCFVVPPPFDNGER